MTGPGHGWQPPSGQGDPGASGPPTAAWFPHGDPQTAPVGIGYGDNRPRPEAPPPQLPPPPPPPRRGFGGGRLAAVIVAAVLVVAVAVIAIVLTVGGDTPTPTGQVAATGPSTADFPSTADSPSEEPASTEPATSAAPTSAPPTVSSTGIDIAAVASDPNVVPVTAVFDTYFAGVNAHDAAAAASVFAPGNNVDPNNPDQVSSFGESIATTSDSAIVVRSITPTATGVDAALTFTSNQAPDLGPDGQACTNWSIVYHLVPVGAGFGILKADADYLPC